MAKILVVDDEADLELLVKQKFRRKIRENIYEFVFAQNGVEALEKVKEHPDLDIILSDINMPVMDGLTLLSRLPEANPMLKSVAQAGQIIISERVYKNAKESFSCEKIGEVKLKNKSQPVVIYQVLE